MSQSAGDLQRYMPGRAPSYRSRLRRRVFGALAMVGMSVVVVAVALGTRLGQAVDTMVMEASAQYLSPPEGWEAAGTGVVSVMNIVLVSCVVGAVAVVRRRATLAARALGIIAVSNVATQVLKWLLVRPDLDLTFVFPNSLPSGHVSVVASCAAAMVVVAPDYLRSLAAWVGWLWISFMGMIVMIESWHRLSDVLVSIMIVGVCALVLAPIESQARHFVVGQRVMGIMTLCALVGAALLSIWVVWNIDVVAAAQLSASDFGFARYLSRHPGDAALVSVAGLLWVVGVAGVVVHEVDHLRWPLAAR